MGRKSDRAAPPKSRHGDVIAREVEFEAVLSIGGIPWFSTNFGRIVPGCQDQHRGDAIIGDSQRNELETEVLSRRLVYAQSIDCSNHDAVCMHETHTFF
jgi:hypothetical protein